MGTTYTIHTLRGAAGRDVLEFMRRRGFAAFVSSGSDGYTVVLEADSEGQGAWVSDLAQELSKQFACPLLAVMVHDDDVTYYELWNAGARRDVYDSMPGFPSPVDRSPEGGNAAELVKLMGQQASDIAAITRILRAEHGVDEPQEYLFEHKRHQDLVCALGLPNYAAGFGYRHLAASISAGQPLSSDFRSTGVTYEEPKLVASTMNDADADVVVDITLAGTAFRVRDRDDAVNGEPDIGAQLLAIGYVSASAMVALRASADASLERVADVLRSLRGAGFTRVVFASGPKR